MTLNENLVLYANEGLPDDVRDWAKDVTQRMRQACRRLTITRDTIARDLIFWELHVNGRIYINLLDKFHFQKRTENQNLQIATQGKF